MRLKVLGLALLMLFSMQSTEAEAGSLLIEKNIQEDLKLEGVLLSQQAGQEPIGERLKVAGLSEKEAKSFLEIIQKNVAQNNIVALSKIVSYPINLELPTGRTVKVINPKQFIVNYPKFVTPKWKKAVLEATYERLFANWQGVMIGRGEIWFSEICQNQSCTKREVKIKAMNPWSGN